MTTNPGNEGLTCPFLDEGVVEVVAAAGADGDVVESSRHQRVKNTLGTGLRHGQRVNRLLPVPQSHQVTVHLTCRRTPRHAKKIGTTIITDRHLAHGGWDCRERKRAIMITLSTVSRFITITESFKQHLYRNNSVPSFLIQTVDDFVRFLLSRPLRHISSKLTLVLIQYYSEKLFLIVIYNLLTSTYI